MNKDIKWIIIETLDITPSEFEKRFEVDTHFMPNEDIYIKQVAEKCYNLNRGQLMDGTNIKTPFVGKINPIGVGNISEVNY